MGVLVIDDNESVRSVVRDILEMYGFDVVLAEDGLTGLALLEAEEPQIDAVLVDLTMPRLDGIQTAAEIRRRSANVPILLMSGQGEADMTASADAFDFFDFVQKPFDIPALAATVRRAVELGARHGRVEHR